jgi:phosphate transport system protein
LTTPATPHLEAQLQHDLDQLRTKILEMAALDEKALTRALQSFLNRDRHLAYSVILRDQYVDELETELDQLCLTFILRHQPAASHLRFVYSASNVVHELERIGDYAESIGRQVLQFSSMDLDIPLDKFIELANQSIPMLHNAARAFVDRNADLARMTMANEPHVRQIRDALSSDLVEWRQQGRLTLESLEPLATVARRFERVMEQAINICEEALYCATGEYHKHRRPDGFRILFVDDANTCVSQMAEAIGRSLDLNRLSFSSGGLRVGVVDPQTIRFMEGKGIDLSTHVSKSMRQIPQLDQIPVVVVLNKEAEKVVATLPTKTLKISWFIPDPSLAVSPGGQDAAYQRTYDELSNHIKDLAEAILGDEKESSDDQV